MYFCTRKQQESWQVRLKLFNGVMVAQQILVLLVQVRALVEQQKNDFLFVEHKLFNGVMVAQQILVLLVQVRALVEQQRGLHRNNCFDAAPF